MKTVNCNNCGNELRRKSSPCQAHIKVHYCNNRCKANWQMLQRPVSRSWLHHKYLVENLDCVEISKIVKRNPKRVWEWLKYDGITVRGRGVSTAKHIRGKSNANLGKKQTPEFRARLSKIAKDSGRVPYDPKVGSYMKGRKGADTPNWKGGITPDRQKVHGSPEWKSAIKIVWKRDNATCQRCGLRHGKKRIFGQFDIHHIKDFSHVELRCVPSNLVLLCEKCHYWVHSLENKNKDFIK